MYNKQRRQSSDLSVVFEQFCLPVLLKCNPSCLPYTLQELDSKKISGHDSLPAMISFLRVARVHGLIVNQREQVEDVRNLWHGTVPVEKMRKALRHADDQVSGLNRYQFCDLLYRVVGNRSALMLSL